jgi:hypothetical protein
MPPVEDDAAVADDDGAAVVVVAAVAASLELALRRWVAVLSVMINNCSLGTKKLWAWIGWPVSVVVITRVVGV